MTTPPPPDRDRALDDIFGEVLPSTTSDERDPEPEENRDEWYQRERPPHHDDRD